MLETKWIIKGSDNNIIGESNLVTSSSNIVNGNSIVYEIKDQDLINIRLIVSLLGKSIFLSKNTKWFFTIIYSLFLLIFKLDKYINMLYFLIIK